MHVIDFTYIGFRALKKITIVNVEANHEDRHN